MYTSTQAALQALDDLKADTLDRESAVRYLADQIDTGSMDRVIAALDDDAFGVRWTAATVLAQKGEAVLPQVLSTFIVHDGSNWMREGLYHIVHYNASLAIQKKSAELMAALKGPGADIAAPLAASRLLQSLR